MIEEIANIRGRHPRIIEVPVLTPRLSSYWLELVTPVYAATARPLIDGTEPFEEAARTALTSR
jgi:hypothetical protein